MNVDLSLLDNTAAKRIYDWKFNRRKLSKIVEEAIIRFDAICKKEGRAVQIQNEPGYHPHSVISICIYDVEKYIHELTIKYLFIPTENMVQISIEIRIRDGDIKYSKHLCRISNNLGAAEEIYTSSIAPKKYKDLIDEWIQNLYEITILSLYCKDKDDKEYVNKIKELELEEKPAI